MSMNRPLHKELKEAYQVFLKNEKRITKARKEANKIIAEAEENAETIISDIRKMQLESGQQGGVKEHQLIDAKTQLLNYTMKKPSLLKQSAEEGERTEKLKAAMK